MALKLSDLQGEYEEIEAPKQGLAAGFGTFAKGVGVGALKSVGETALGIGQIGRGIQSRISGFAPSIFKTGDSIFDPARAEEIRQTTLAANAPGQGTGKFLGTVAQYMLPTSKISKGQQILGAAASKVPTTGGAQLLAKGAARFLPEAAGTGAVAFTRSGGDLEQTKNEALIAGGFSVGLGALGGIARSTYWPTLDDSVNKALGTQGKKSGGVALKQTAEKVSGLQVLKQRAPKLTVTLDDGTKAAFNPESASYGTTLQAWNEARKQIFDEYTAIAKKAGEKATLDLSAVRKQMAEALDAPVLSVEKNAVKSILNDFDSIFKDPTKVDMQTAERFVKSLNENTVNGFFAGTSDAASSKVYAGTSKLIRESMDDVIEETTGAQYQATRSQYAALKSLENDLVRKFQQDARQIGGGLPEYTGAFASGDIIGSALSLDPAQFAKGATLGTFSVLKRKLSNPERFLRRSFDLIDDVPSDFSLRLWGGVGELTDAEKQFAKEMIPEGTAMSQGGYVGNVPKGFPKGVTPSTTLLDEAKGKTLDEFVENQMTRGDGMQHRPTFTRATAADVSQKASDFGLPDFYKNPQAYRTGNAKADNESIQALLKVRNKPDAEVTIYRASPKNELRDGDWVTLSKEYAQGESLAEGTKVHSFTVKAKDIHFAGDSINEFGYFPSTKVDELSEVWKKATRDGADVEDAYLIFLRKNTDKYKTVNEWISAMKASGKTRTQLEDIWKQANRTASADGSLKGALTNTPSLMDEAKKLNVDLSALEKSVDNKIAKGQEWKKYIDTEAKKIADSVQNTKLATAPIKSKERIVEKTIKEELGNLENIKDIARNTIVPYDQKAYQEVLKQMDARADIALKTDGTKMIKHQAPEQFMGYEGYIYNIKTPDGQIVETQVVTPKMTYGKNTEKFSREVLGDELFEQIRKETGLEPGKGHEYYEIFRKMSIADKESELGKKIIQDSIDYYSQLK